MQRAESRDRMKKKREDERENEREGQEKMKGDRDEKR